MSLHRTLFLKPRFHGGRFDDHCLPLEILPDLEVYGQIVREVARALYLRDHPTRRRVPRGFEDDFSLALTAIEEGSTVPVLERIEPRDRFPFGGDYFDRARDLINRAVDRAAGSEEPPDEFPPELLHSFDRFGRGLQQDEAVELCLPDRPTGPRFTPEVRKRLILGKSSTYRKEVHFSGEVIAANVKKRFFQVRCPDTISFDLLPPEHEAAVLAALKDHGRLDIDIHALATFDRKDRLQRVEEIRTLEVFESLRPYDERLKELQVLQPGWLDGMGEPVSEAALRVAQSLRQVLEWFAATVPYLYPTPDGGLQAEWSLEERKLEATLCIEPDGSVLFTWTGPGGDGEQLLDVEAAGQDGLLRLLTLCLEG